MRPCLLAYLVGPLNQPEWRGLVVSLTGALAAELRDAISATAEASGLLVAVRKSPVPGEITGDNGARLTILASDKATGHAVGADIAVVDEAGLLQENAPRFVECDLHVSVSGRDGRLLAISIRGDGPMFAEMAERSIGDSVVWHEFTRRRIATFWIGMLGQQRILDSPPVSRSLSYMQDASRRAVASPADQPAFRAYDLNQPRSPSTETL